MKNIKKIPLPGTIFIAINNRCNMKCLMCDVGRGVKDSQFYKIMCPEGRQLELSILERLAGELAAFKPVIAVTSTEPLLFEGLFEFARIVKSHGMVFQLTTNGYRLPEYASEVVESGIDLVCVSLDGPPAIHDKIRGCAGAFSAAVTGIKMVRAISGKKGRKLTINVNCTISAYNHRHLFEFVSHLENLPVDSLTVSHLNYVTENMAARHNALYGELYRATPSCVPVSGRSPADSDFSSISLWEQICSIRKKSWKFQVFFTPDLDYQGIVDHYFHPEVIVSRRKCQAPWICAQLSASGDWVVTTRCFYAVMGNVFEENFMDTWYGKRYHDFREWIGRVNMTPACTRCCGVL